MKRKGAEMKLEKHCKLWLKGSCHSEFKRCRMYAGNDGMYHGTFGEDDMGELLKLLEQHRSCLLSTVHEREKQIDCLDYLVYQIKQNKE